ncbi:MAG: type II toxin-antitoxin system VapC family toxin [Xanthobacteraceae bacterium]|nr:type II toxin-antitoxin system VapC family toxin [Xanthobacteraceae bacterium]MBV9628682.1 type II toxin-antitoxin system VapC family toxin [Xanthobacteraceae bacterium]
MALIDDLGAGPVCLDTALVIYLIEENQLFSAVIAPLFEAADAGELELVVSALTLLEVLVVPYRAGNIALAERYEAVLTRSRGMRMIDLTREHMRLAAQLRAASSVATPDALQLATCLASRCSAFVTNDRRLPSIPGLRIIQLRDYSV